MIEGKKFSLVKPTLDTPFHVDFEWWRQSDRNWHVALLDLLCPEHRQEFSEMSEGQMIDWIDPETAEVRQVDGLQNVIITHCACQEDFLTAHTAMVDAVFRLLLAGGNVPMTAVELGERLNRPADTILRTLAGVRVYKGIRPLNT
ncbi:MAG: hypothetical protein JXB85_03210 [Anaerolineales bacterium]|nr:hypothetical protein [Anaerolineales bacterium]